MRLILYGTVADKSEIEQAISAVPELCYRRIDMDHFSDYDRFLAGLRATSPDCAIISIDGAEGMEGVMAAKNICRDIPILWFSSDGGFGAQAYRLGCAYFHQKPVLPDILSAAIAKCV